VTRYGLRIDSGGQGRHCGGEGLIREYEFLTPTHVTLLTERRRHPPWGLAGAAAARCGENLLNGMAVSGKVSLQLQPGDRLTVKTAGGGGYGGA
jgi:N-methylhydantoinase B